MATFEVGEKAHYYDERSFDNRIMPVTVVKITKTQITVIDDKQQKHRFRVRDNVMINYYTEPKLIKFDAALAERYDIEKRARQQKIEHNQRIGALKLRISQRLSEIQSRIYYCYDEESLQHVLTQCELLNELVKSL